MAWGCDGTGLEPVIKQKVLKLDRNTQSFKFRAAQNRMNGNWGSREQLADWSAVEPATARQAYDDLIDANAQSWLELHGWLAWAGSDVAVLDAASWRCLLRAWKQHCPSWILMTYYCILGQSSPDHLRSASLKITLFEESNPIIPLLVHCSSHLFESCQCVKFIAAAMITNPGVPSFVPSSINFSRRSSVHY